VKELKAFQKVYLQPGEKALVKLEVSKNSLGFYDDDMRYLLEDGEFYIFVGTNSKDCLQEELKITFQR
jgi:beta-glucosidase